ncbi:MAG: hypothetical protein IT350_00155 [Deltaproteobacteria bacterium]|nr:hypothetical protein [Deltaproteobacteria bacterium]
MSSVLEHLRTWLAGLNVPVREVHHEPTRTSEESARVRGEELRVGGKAIVLKVDDVFALFVFSAERRLDSGAVRRELGARRTRFATPEELAEMTGLVPGAVPPFGRPILPFDLYIDPSIPRNDRIAFNAGSLTDSMILPMEDYLRVAGGRVMTFTKDAE